MRIALISIFIAVTLLLIVGVIYIVRHFHRFGFIQKIAEKHKLISWIVSFIPIAIVSCFFVINIYSPIIVLIHLFFIWLICDIVSRVIKKTTKQDFKRYYSGAVAIAFTIIYLSHGWFCAHHVYQTNYTFETTKDIGSPIRIVEIADSHLGITLDGDEFADEMKKVQETSPDAVVIAGDFVDDDTYQQSCNKYNRGEQHFASNRYAFVVEEIGVVIKEGKHPALAQVQDTPCNDEAHQSAYQCQYQVFPHHL